LYAISRQAAMTIIPWSSKKDRANLRIFSQYIYQKKDILARVFSHLLFLSFSGSPLVRPVKGSDTPGKIFLPGIPTDS